MVEKLNELIRLLNNLPIKDVKDHIQTTFYEVIKKKYKKDYENISKRIENGEILLFRELLGNITSNLDYRINLYETLNNLEFLIKKIKELVDIDLKKIIFIKYYFYPPKYAFIKSLLSLSKCGLCITSRILVPR